VSAELLAQAAGERWSVQPSLALTALVLVLIAGFWLGRISHEVHSRWLNLWDQLSVWVTWTLAGVGACTVLWLIVSNYGGPG
jgi:hypothetical protein